MPGPVDALPRLGTQARMCPARAWVVAPWHGSGTAPIPFGGQTGRSICRGNRDSALIRKAKQPRDRVLMMPFDISPDTASRALGRVNHGGKTVIGSQIGGRWRPALARRVSSSLVSDDGKPCDRGPTRAGL